jgi:hypothetical protein
VVQHPAALRSVFQADTTLCFRIADGRTLRVRRGDVRCAVSIRGKKEGKYNEDSEWVIAALDVADSHGAVFRFVKKSDRICFSNSSARERRWCPSRRAGATVTQHRSSVCGGDQGEHGGSVVSHSYLRVKPLPDVWNAFLQIGSKFR